jgi:chaperonin GroEL
MLKCYAKSVWLMVLIIALKTLKLDNEDQNRGVKIVMDALTAPSRSIAKNAGFAGDVVVGKLLEGNEGKVRNTRGFNAATGEYVDMVKAGIIDPTKVI